MEKGQTARRYVSVWPREAVNNAGDEAIAIDGALLCLFDGELGGNESGSTGFPWRSTIVSAGYVADKRGGT